MSEIKLLPCPFCGGEAVLYHQSSIYTDYDGNFVHCIECGCRTKLFECYGNTTKTHEDTKQEAIETWNTRKPMERIIERIENARQKYQRLVKEQGEKEDEAMNIHFRGVMNIVKEEGGIE